MVTLKGPSLMQPMLKHFRRQVRNGRPIGAPVFLLFSWASNRSERQLSAPVGYKRQNQNMAHATIPAAAATNPGAPTSRPGRTKTTTAYPLWAIGPAHIWLRAFLVLLRWEPGTGWRRRGRKWDKWSASNGSFVQRREQVGWRVGRSWVETMVHGTVLY